MYIIINLSVAEASTKSKSHLYSNRNKTLKLSSSLTFAPFGSAGESAFPQQIEDRMPFTPATRRVLYMEMASANGDKINLFNQLINVEYLQ